MDCTTLLIDLDETVYPASCGVWEAIAQRMEQYLHHKMGYPHEEISGLRRSLFEQYGTTLRGLQTTRHVDTEEYLAYVHDIPLTELLQPDPGLRDVLMRYHQRKIIFTNADRNHAMRVLTRLNLQDCFDGIIDIHDIDPYCKPMPEAFQIALRLSGETDPACCAFLDDSPRNLISANAAGMYTIQVGAPKPGVHHPPSGAHAHIARLADLPSIIPIGVNE